MILTPLSAETAVVSAPGRNHARLRAALEPME